jgi:hypothetical protein
MRILICAPQRTGSSTLLNWIYKETKLIPIFEPFNEVDIGDPRSFNNNWIDDYDNFIKMDGYVTKILVHVIDQRKELIPLDDKFFTHFTKVIVLHRENIRDQSISKVIAENILGNHMINYKYDDVKNYIDNNLVNDWEKMFEENNLYVSNLKNNCNHFTYEEIYVRKEYGRLCEYLGIGDPKYLHLLDRTNRYRK